jgi:hypothetical protein
MPAHTILEDEELKELAFIIYQSFYEMFENQKIVTNNINLNKNMNENNIKQMFERIDYYNPDQFRNGIANELKNAFATNDYDFFVKKGIHDPLLENQNLQNRLNSINQNQIVDYTNNNRIKDENLQQVDSINSVNLRNKVNFASENQIEEKNLKLSFFDRFKEIFGKKEVKDLVDKTINDSTTAIKEKSYKRFAVTVAYFLLTLIAVILDSMYANNATITAIIEVLKSPNTIGILSGYIGVQTVTDIFRISKNK